MVTIIVKYQLILKCMIYLKYCLTGYGFDCVYLIIFYIYLKNPLNPIHKDMSYIGSF